MNINDREIIHSSYNWFITTLTFSHRTTVVVIANRQLGIATSNTSDLVSERVSWYVIKFGDFLAMGRDELGMKNDPGLFDSDRPTKTPQRYTTTHTTHVTLYVNIYVIIEQRYNNNFSKTDVKYNKSDALLLQLG